jgi:dihydroorotate dehydrogenase electron transfer subunit
MPVMKKKLLTARIADQKSTAQGIFRISIYVPEFFAASAPGQFVMIRLRDCVSTFLARPISIHSIYRKSRRTICELMYQVVGKGTRAMSELKKGDEVLINGPLGKGFDVENLPDQVVLIAGGMGIAPLRYAAEKIREAGPGRNIVCYQGARSRDMLPDVDGLESVCSRLVIGTDDGSAGRKGFVTDLFSEELSFYTDKESVVYACGPHEMLCSLKKKLLNRRIPCRVSVEERMACGVGACLGCAVRIASGEYRCACCDGPVFDINELDLENGA